MIAICFSDWNEVSLVVNRISGVFVALVGLVALFRIWRSQPGEMAKRAVPRPVLVFTIAWLGVLLAILLDLLIGECEIVLSAWKRTVYGAAYVWSLGGLAWVVLLGQRHSAQVKSQTLTPEDLAKAVREELEVRAPQLLNYTFTDKQQGGE